MEPAQGCFAFDAFVLDPAERQLSRGGDPVELNGRYLDALILLVGERGKLVTKDRFLEQVWRGVPVTDEALTQCIRTLRRQLGDDAAAPRFIETVPKHGYRFIAPVEAAEEGGHEPELPMKGPAGSALPLAWRRFFLLGLAGTAGGGFAGLVGGLFYGLAGTAEPLRPGMGAASVLIVLVCATLLVALVGAAGVAFGIAAADFAPARRWQWRIAGGALGGFLVGAFVKLLALDAFNLLLGRVPGDITGAPEGALLGAAVGVSAGLALREGEAGSFRRGVAVAGLMGAAAGALIALLGGRLMGGSLALLAATFPASRLRLDQIGALLGEEGFGRASQALAGAAEGLLFAACIVGAMLLAQRSSGRFP